jgi:hypothetical protein
MSLEVEHPGSNYVRLVQALDSRVFRATNSGLTTQDLRSALFCEDVGGVVGWQPGWLISSIKS